MSRVTAKPYRIELSSVGNPDFGQFAPLSNPRTILLETLEEASRVAQLYRNDWNLGGGNWTNPPVIDNATGEQIAYVSFNGRVWPGAAYDPDAEPLCEAVHVERKF